MTVQHQGNKMKNFKQIVEVLAEPITLLLPHVAEMVDRHRSMVGPIAFGVGSGLLVGTGIILMRRSHQDGHSQIVEWSDPRDLAEVWCAGIDDGGNALSLADGAALVNSVFSLRIDPLELYELEMDERQTLLGWCAHVHLGIEPGVSPEKIRAIKTKLKSNSRRESGLCGLRGDP